MPKRHRLNMFGGIGQRHQCTHVVQVLPSPKQPPFARVQGSPLQSAISPLSVSVSRSAMVISKTAIHGRNWCRHRPARVQRIPDQLRRRHGGHAAEQKTMRVKGRAAGGRRGVGPFDRSWFGLHRSLRGLDASHGNPLHRAGPSSDAPHSPSVQICG